MHFLIKSQSLREPSQITFAFYHVRTSLSLHFLCSKCNNFLTNYPPLNANLIWEASLNLQQLRYSALNILLQLQAPEPNLIRINYLTYVIYIHTNFRLEIPRNFFFFTQITKEYFSHFFKNAQGYCPVLSVELLCFTKIYCYLKSIILISNFKDLLT